MNYEIEIQPESIKFQASPSDTVLNAAISNGLFLEHSCRKGDCGLCSAELLSGIVRNEHGNIVSSGRILTCCSSPRSNLKLLANYIPELAGIDCVTLPCKVVSLDLKTDDIVTLFLRIPPTERFNYLPGQYIDLIYNGIRRSYSIANSQAVSSGIELHIKLIPKGEFSHLLANNCEVNQLMRIEGPKGTFFVRNATNPIIFLAGGTGFAPIKAMVEDLLKNKIERTLHIYWGMTNSRNFYTDIVSNWAEQYSSVHYVPVVSEVDKHWDGRRGLVHKAVLEDFPDLSSYHVYACGAPLMINDAKETFISQGLKESNFFADVFISSK
ncbi:MAG: 2Fe-2S iron-sulfur cluster binding domain-containing protein [Legionella sp.]|nr:MAG: 2Fe-2S iron-sulfur cluster binding domain-containing protein [Legionella sp.]